MRGVIVGLKALHDDLTKKYEDVKLDYQTSPPARGTSRPGYYYPPRAHAEKAPGTSGKGSQAWPRPPCPWTIAQAP